jgi:hypothetical protein
MHLGEAGVNEITSKGKGHLKASRESVHLPVFSFCVNKGRD